MADEYYSDNGFAEWLIEQGETEETIGRHAGLDTTSELLAVAPEHIRREKLAKAESPATDGYSGDPTRVSVEYGRAGLELKIETAVHQIRLQMEDRKQ